MRIISGIHSGRRFEPPHGLDVRPTTDTAREALFNVIACRFDFAAIEALDLFAGTGSIDYEFASRGCPHIDSVDTGKRQCQFIVKTAEAFGMQGIHTYCGDGFAYLQQCRRKYDIIFADPPFALDGVEEIPNIVFDRALLQDSGWLIIEHGGQKHFEQHPHFLQHRRYGSVNFSIFA